MWAWPLANQKEKKKIKKNMMHIKRGKLSKVFSCLNQDTDIDIFFNKAKIIAHASHHNICLIRISRDIKKRPKNK